MFPLLIFLSSLFFANCNDTQTCAATTKEPEVKLYIYQSKYEEWLKLGSEIPELRRKQHLERKALRKKHGAELKKNDRTREQLYLKIHDQKVNFESDLWKQKHLKNSLIYFKYLTILQNHIEEYERIALHFEPNMNQVKRNHHTMTSQDEEIRRQKWNYLLYHCSGFQDVHDLIGDFDRAGIQIKDFSALVARGYKLLSRYLRPNQLHEVVPTRNLPDFGKNITGDALVDKCFVVLLEDYRKKKGKKVRPPQFPQTTT